MTAGGFRYTIRPDQHTVIVGRNGTGKTTLGRLLIAGYRTSVIVDPKRRFELAGVPVVVGLEAFRQAWPQRVRKVIVRPTEADVADPKKFWEWADGVFIRILQFGRTAVLVDECLDLATATRIVPGYRRALRQGREPLVPVFSCTQRPSGCHNDVFSESVHLFVFDLNLESDRRKVAGIGGDELMTRADERFPQEHGFAYHGPETSGGVVWCPPLRVPAGQLPPAPYTQPGPSTPPGSGG
jgi:energy-coupling factor transporter ATP-binding protein EcfA2